MKLRRNIQLLKFLLASGPLDSVAIDIFGPLFKTGRDNNYLLVICYRFTKLTRMAPLRGVTVAEVARAFRCELVSNYEGPQNILPENGKCFTSKFVQNECTKLKVKNQFTRTYYPLANGRVERYNRTLKASVEDYHDNHPKH